jgi:hypothetical protein
MYLGVEYALVQSWFFNSGFVSHRTEFVNTYLSSIASIRASISLWMYGLSSHANVHQFPVILISVLAAIILSFIKKIKGNSILFILLLLTIGLSVLSCLYQWEGIKVLTGNSEFFRSFDFSRFSWLLPGSFYLLFFSSLQVVEHSFKKSLLIIILLLAFQTGLEFKRNTSNRTLYNKISQGTGPSKAKTGQLTYRQYYSEDLFRDVKTYIGIEQDKYRILCLGIDPGVLSYNGFYTLDAYIANYPLSYKHEFRKVIEKELDKDNSLKTNFDTFGSTCYLFSSELVKYQPYTKLNAVEVSQLEINLEQVKKLGGNYIVSAVKINNAEQLGLSLEHLFEHPASLYTIYLYKIKQELANIL